MTPSTNRWASSSENFSRAGIYPGRGFLIILYALAELEGIQLFISLNLSLSSSLQSARPRNLSPVRDEREKAGVESRSDGTPANHKNNLNPERSEWVVEAAVTH